VLDRPAGGRRAGIAEGLDAARPPDPRPVRPSGAQPSVVIASERMDNDPGWRLLDPGELLHVSSTLEIERSAPFRRPRTC